MATDFDTRAFEAGVKKQLRAVEVDARRVVTAAGEEAAETAKGLARRDSGTMADSIEATPGQNVKGPYSDVTVDPFYSSFQEWGTSEVPAQPFIRPSTKAAAFKHLRRRK